MPIHSDCIKQPVNPVLLTFVPDNGYRYPLKEGDSWVSLAASLAPTGAWSPWDLIRYNYPTLPHDPQLASKEVNWYLKNYLGCTLLTENKRNYRFSPPGKIWLPNEAAADQVARNLVLSTLRGPVVGRMNFGVGALMILSKSFEDVAKAIEAGKIVVKAKSGHIALYHGYLKPALIEVSPTLGDLGLIIHECTHAIFDILKISSRVEQSEAFGYLSQALYKRLVRGGPPPNRYMVSSDPADLLSWASWQLIFDESTRLAGILATKNWVSEDDASRLFRAITTANIYRSRTGKVEANEGI